MDADFMFKYQPVYDPKRKKLVPLTELNEDDENYKKFRELISLNNLSEEQVNNLAYGNLDPFSLLKLDDWKPSTHSTTLVSILGILKYWDMLNELQLLSRSWCGKIALNKSVS